MNNKIYQKKLKTESPDNFDYPPYVCVTEENNGHFVWLDDPENMGQCLLRYAPYDKNKAIESGVIFGQMKYEDLVDKALGGKL